MKIRDIMKSQVISVDRETKINEIAQILFKNKFHALPVVENGEVVGIITENDFFIKEAGNLYLPAYISSLEKLGNIDNLSEEKKHKIEKLLNLRAKDIMTERCVCLSPEDDVMEIIKTYKKTGYNTYPVVEKNSLVGIATSSDVMGLIKRF